MRYEIVKTPEHIEICKKIIAEHDSIARVDLDKTDIRNNIIELLTSGATGKNPNVISAILFDVDSEPIGISTMQLGEKLKKTWFVRQAFISKLGKERYGSLKIVQAGMERAFIIAEKHDRYECFYSVRLARHKTLEHYLNNIEYLKNYKVQTIEVLEPFSLSINPLINHFILGLSAGLNPKPMAIIRIYNPDKIEHEYPFPIPQQN